MSNDTTQAAMDENAGAQARPRWGYGLALCTLAIAACMQPPPPVRPCDIPPDLDDLGITSNGAATVYLASDQPVIIEELALYIDTGLSSPVDGAVIAMDITLRRGQGPFAVRPIPTEYRVYETYSLEGAERNPSICGVCVQLSSQNKLLHAQGGILLLEAVDFANMMIEGAVVGPEFQDIGITSRIDPSCTSKLNEIEFQIPITAIY